MKDIKNMSDKEKKEAINKLVADIDCLEPLYQWTNDLNIFNVLKLDRIEIRHSNMLAWLLNPNELHGLTDKLLKKILIKAAKDYGIEIMNGLTPVDVEAMNFDDIVIERERNNIDILAVSKTNKLILAIENKIDSKEHSNQLERYKKWLLEEYPKDYYYVLIYLTPRGEESSDNENWASMDYGFVAEQIEKLVKIYKIPDKAKLYIDDYTKAIRRSVVKDKEIEEICRKIYIAHRDAFDLVFEYKPDICSQISDYIYNYLRNHEGEFQIDVWKKYYKHNLDFTPKAISAVCGNWGNGDWNDQKNLIGFEFYIGEDYGVKLSTIIGPAASEYEKYRQKLFDIANASKYFDVPKGKLTNVWKTIDTEKLVDKKLIDEIRGKSEEEIKEVLDSKIGKEIEIYIKDKMQKIVSELLKAFQN